MQELKKCRYCGGPVHLVSAERIYGAAAYRLGMRRVTEAEFLAADAAEIESSKAACVEKIGKQRYEELCRIRSDRENGIGEQFGLFGGQL